jgi:alkanesulfonate monooxygenase SsuD/methylene tetrahydromethanopterin reductase-like flavin-dependent oxidoreductase (luciferase family)
MVAGRGDKVLTLAAQHADIVGIAGVASDAELADRIQALRRQHGISHVSFNALDGIAWANLEKLIAAVK